MTEQFISHSEIQLAARYVSGHTRHHPAVGVILGSGLNPLAGEIGEADVIPYRDIPNFPVSTVEGHSGDLVIGRWAGKTILAMRGRAHYYEGYSMQQVTLPVRVMRELGIETVIITNAAGGLNPAFHPGDLMLITDHINLVGMAGLNPLRGPNDANLGPRFPDMTAAYDPSLQELARSAASQMGLKLSEGTYIMLAGPSYESPADVRFVRSIGADAVGMSTVPEVIVARHGGMRVLGISLISNSLAGGHDLVSHAEVLAAGVAAMPKFIELIKRVVARL